MRLARTYSIRTRRVEFEFTPYHKFNFLMDDSGKGKTAMLKEIAYAAGCQKICKEVCFERWLVN